MCVAVNKLPSALWASAMVMQPWLDARFMKSVLRTAGEADQPVASFDWFETDPAFLGHVSLPSNDLPPGKENFDN